MCSSYNMKRKTHSSIGACARMQFTYWVDSYKRGKECIPVHTWEAAMSQKLPYLVEKILTVF